MVVFREYLPGKGFKQSPAFVMRVSEDEMENEESDADSDDVESQALVVGTRFTCDDDFRFWVILAAHFFI